MSPTRALTGTARLTTSRPPPVTDCPFTRSRVAYRLRIGVLARPPAQRGSPKERLARRGRVNRHAVCHVGTVPLPQPGVRHVHPPRLAEGRRRAARHRGLAP